MRSQEGLTSLEMYNVLESYHIFPHSATDPFVLMTTLEQAF